MKTLQSVLKSLISICSLLILELHFLIILLLYLIYKFADKKSHKAIERILLVRHIIMTQYFLKAVYYFVIRSEILQLVLAQWWNPDVISLTVIIKNKIVNPRFIIGFIPNFKAFFIIMRITIYKDILVLLCHFYYIGIIGAVNNLRFHYNITIFPI